MKNKKILFIVVPNYRLLDKSNVINYRPPFLIPPYGALSLSSYIQEHSKNELEIEILDLNEIIYDASIDMEDKSTHEDLLIKIDNWIEDKINEFMPEIIACSLLFNSGFEYVESISNTLERVKGDSLVVFGGKVPSNHYRNFIEEFKGIDAVSLGEGEIPMLKLADSDDYKLTLEENSSFITKEKLDRGILPKRQLVENLDEIPPFNFDLLNLEKYIPKYVSSLASLEVKAKTIARGIQIISTRGCPFDCIFCTSHAVHGKKIRYRSAESIVDEIVHLVEKYKLNIISIQDDNFFHKKERAIKILDRLIELDLDVNYEFANGIAIYCVDEDIASRLQILGLKEITIAVESGSPYVLNKIIKKPLRVDMVKPAVNILRKYGLRVYGSFVFGFPGEHEEDRQKSLELINEVGFDWVHLFAAIPFSGSRLYDICLEKNYITDASEVITSTTKYSNGIINTEDFTAEYINRFVYTNNLRFNFINNYNFRRKEYKVAIMYFAKVLEDFTDHAVAHYMIWKSYEALGDKENASKYRLNYMDIISKNEFWRQYSKDLNLDIF